MLVKDILLTKGARVVTIPDDATVHDAIRQLNAHRIGALVVTDDRGDIRGIISERDILRECGDPHAGDDPFQTRVRDVMSADVIIGVPDDQLSYVMGIMTRNRIRHLPIVVDGQLAGIISIGDVVNAHVEKTTFENRMLKDYIEGALP